MPCYPIRSQGKANPFADSQVKQASIDHAPFQAEETWVDSVAEANAAAPETASDPTVAHAGLTELDAAGGPNGMSMSNNTETVTSPPQAGAGDVAGNAAGDRWDTTTGAEKALAEDEYTIVPRPQDEVDTPASAGPAGATQEKITSWADEPPAYEAAATGNLAGENWDMKTAGDQTDNSWADGATQAAGDGWGDGTADASGTTQEEGDGFHQVPGRHRGRGRGRGGDGEFRGRGRGRGGFRGDGEFRGRGRGGFRGGRGEMGEFRGRGGGYRGRGFRSGAEGQTRGS